MILTFSVITLHSVILIQSGTTEDNPIPQLHSPG